MLKSVDIFLVLLQAAPNKRKLRRGGSLTALRKASVCSGITKAFEKQIK